MSHILILLEIFFSSNYFNNEIASSEIVFSKVNFDSSISNLNKLYVSES